MTTADSLGQNKGSIVMQKKLRFVILGVVLLGVLSCVTSVRDMNVDSVELTVKNKAGTQVTSLLPDTTYYINFEVVDSNGKEYANPDHRDFRFEHPQNFKVVRQLRLNAEIRTDKSTFHPPGTDLYSFLVSIKENSGFEKKFSFPLNWAEFSLIDYSGEDGIDGENGESGKAATGSSADKVAGSNGEDGEAGTNGQDGESLRVLATKYKYNGEEKMLLYIVEHEHLYLSDIKEVTIDVSGGDAGNGGDGGNGGSGKTWDNGVDPPVAGVAGNPGDGGDAGRAGRGGNITVFAYNSALFDYINPTVRGGKSGTGGAAGRAYTDGTLAKRGSEGIDSTYGTNGEVRLERKYPEEFREMLLSHIEDYNIDANNIVY